MERMVDDMGDEPSGAVVEIRRAVGDFVHDFKGFQDDMTTKLQQTEERMTMLDRKMTLPARTPLAGAVDGGASHQKAMNAYIRNGDDDGLRGLELESKALSAAVNSDGGYLVDPQTSATVHSGDCLCGSGGSHVV